MSNPYGKQSSQTINKDFMSEFGHILASRKILGVELKEEQLFQGLNTQSLSLTQPLQQDLKSSQSEIHLPYLA